MRFSCDVPATWTNQQTGHGSEQRATTDQQACLRETEKHLKSSVRRHAHPNPQERFPLS